MYLNTQMVILMILYRTLQCSRITLEDTKYRQPQHPATYLGNLFVCTPKIISSKCVLPIPNF